MFGLGKEKLTNEEKRTKDVISKLAESNKRCGKDGLSEQDKEVFNDLIMKLIKEVTPPTVWERAEGETEEQKALFILKRRYKEGLL